MRADPADLELVWINLLENAARYSPRGSRVVMRLKTEGADAIVTVSDRGCGIPESQLPRIFDRFYRADPSRSRATGGMGLGLAIAKSIVDGYKGRIFAESKVGNGTQMSVSLRALSTETAARSRGVDSSEDIDSNRQNLLRGRR